MGKKKLVKLLFTVKCVSWKNLKIFIINNVKLISKKLVQLFPADVKIIY